MKKSKENKLEIKYVKPSELIPFVGNPRNNENAIEPVKRSIEHFGFVNPIIARTSDNMIISGHTRWKAALKDELETVPVIFVEMSENDAKLYNLADNKLGEFATWDIPGLDTILEELKLLDVDITIAGFADIEKGINDPNEEWQGMPEFEQEDKTAYQTIHIHFKDKGAVEEFSELINQKITEKTRSIWFPEIKIETYADKAYIDEP